MAHPVQLYAALVDANGNDISVASPVVAPGGRLTPTTAVPVPSAAVATAASVFYTPYVSNYIPIWNGTIWVPTTFTELTNTLANSSVGNAGPAAGAASKNYDLFVWNQSGTLYLTRGGAWNSDTVRSAATENDLQRIQGFLCNLNAITNGPGVGAGLYVGTIRTDAGGATVSWSVGAAGSNGTPATINLWNMYNRIFTECVVRDTTASWNYTSATAQSANNSNGNRVSFVRGLDEEGVESSYSCFITTAAVIGAYGSVGICLDVTNAYTGPTIRTTTQIAGAVSNVATAFYKGLPGLGFHFLQAANAGDGTNAGTYTANSSILQALAVGLRW